MSLTKLLAEYAPEDFEVVLTKYLKDPEALKAKIEKESPAFSDLIHEFSVHMHAEYYDSKLEDAFYDGMMTMLELLMYLDKNRAKA